MSGVYPDTALSDRDPAANDTGVDPACPHGARIGDSLVRDSSWLLFFSYVEIVADFYY